MSYVSHADLGGLPGFGPVVPEPEGEPFHAAWDVRVHALTVAMGATGAWNLDMSRAARETLAGYRELSYYELWLEGLSRLLVERGLASADELATGEVREPPVPVPRILRAESVAGVLARGAPTVRVREAPPRFAPGARVRTRAGAVPHHTRLPAYARDRTGVVERILGAHVFPDAHAQGRGDSPQWLYTVCFTGGELWGDGAAARLTVSIDAWEPYLEPA